MQFTKNIQRYSVVQESKLEDEDEIGEGPSSGRKNKRKRRMTALECPKLLSKGTLKA